MRVRAAVLRRRPGRARFCYGKRGGVRRAQARRGRAGVAQNPSRDLCVTESRFESRSGPRASRRGSEAGSCGRLRDGASGTPDRIPPSPQKCDSRQRFCGDAPEGALLLSKRGGIRKAQARRGRAGVARFSSRKILVTESLPIPAMALYFREGILTFVGSDPNSSSYLL